MLVFCCRLFKERIVPQVRHANADGITQLSEFIPHRGNMQNIDSGMGFPKMFFFDTYWCSIKNISTLSQSLD